MAAGMSQLGQGVVLGEEGDGRLPGAIGGLKGSGHLAYPPLDPEPLPLQELRQPGTGLLLLQGDLRVRVDAQAQVNQLLLVPIHLADDLRFKLLGCGLSASHRDGAAIKALLRLQQVHGRLHLLHHPPVLGSSEFCFLLRLSNLRAS